LAGPLVLQGGGSGIFYNPILKTDEDICEQGQGWEVWNEVEEAGAKVMFNVYLAIW